MVNLIYPLLIYSIFHKEQKLVKYIFAWLSFLRTNILCHILSKDHNHFYLFFLITYTNEKKLNKTLEEKLTQK